MGGVVEHDRLGVIECFAGYIEHQGVPVFPGMSRDHGSDLFDQFLLFIAHFFSKLALGDTVKTFEPILGLAQTEVGGFRLVLLGVAGVFVEGRVTGLGNLAFEGGFNFLQGFHEILAFEFGGFSLEMSREQLVMRMLCSQARVPSREIAKGLITAQQHAELVGAADRLIRAPIYLDDTAGLDVAQLRGRARQLRNKHGIEFIVIDYLQMLRSHLGRSESRQQEIADVSNNIKAMAKELHVPVLVLSQLNRSPEIRDRSGKPRLSDLRDSGSIEQDADVVGLLRRPCKYEDKDADVDQTLAIVDIAKQRNGPTGEVRFHFDERITRFFDAAPSYMADEHAASERDDA